MKYSLVAMVIGGILLVFSSGTSGNKEPQKAADSISAAFDAYESAWRDAQKGLAERLERGDIKTEPEATKWFASANASAMRAAFQPVVDAEFESFGGEKWTPGAHAKFIRRYCRD